MIYLDNAATTLKKPDQVAQAVCEALCSLGNAGRGGHDRSLDASRVIFDTRCKLGELFSSEDPGRIAFTLNSTEALNTALKGLLCPGDHVITTELEHNSVLRPLYELEEQLDRGKFVRISNGEIINLDKVTAVDLSLTGTIRMTLGEAGYAYVSRRYVKKIKEALRLERRRTR